MPKNEFQERKAQDTLSKRRQRHEHVGQSSDVPAVSFDGGQETLADIETVDRQEPDPTAAYPFAGERRGKLYLALLRKRSDAGNETFEYRRSCGHDSDYAADV